MKLTKTMVEQAQPGERDHYLWDTALPGFGVKVTPSGGKIYLVQYRPKGQIRITRRYTIGRHEAPWKTEAARTAAADLLARVRLGEDPFQTDKQARQDEAVAHQAAQEQRRREKKERFELVVQEFIARYAKPKNRRWDEAERILTSADVAHWKDRAISTITKREIVELVDGVAERSDGAARLLFAHLRKLFAWCVEKLHLEQSPFVGLKAPSPAKARDRVLNDTEIALLWKATPQLAPPFGALIRLLLLTGQRREEVTAMQWSELDLDKAEWVIPGERAKNGQSHTVDLSDTAVAILRELAAPPEPDHNEDSEPAPPEREPSPFVFTTTGKTPVSGHSKAKTALDQAMVAAQRGRKVPIPAWRIHDLRRTAATGMARLGFAPHVVEAVLNHRSGVRGGLVAVYQHYDHRTERRAALNAWSAHVTDLSD